MIKSNLEVYNNTYFSNSNKDYIYKAKIKAFKNNFGGILIIKQLPTNNHRVVFTSEFGNKFFDFEIGETGFKTHFILDEINKGIVIKTLQNDFENITNSQNVVIKGYQNQTHLIYRAKHKSRFNHFFVNKKTKQLEQIINTTKRREKTVFSFGEIEDNVAKNIEIKHKDIPLTISLTYIK